MQQLGTLLIVKHKFLGSIVVLGDSDNVQHLTSPMPDA